MSESFHLVTFDNLSLVQWTMECQPSVARSWCLDRARYFLILFFARTHMIMWESLPSQSDWPAPWPAKRT